MAPRPGPRRELAARRPLARDGLRRLGCRARLLARSGGAALALTAVLAAAAQDQGGGAWERFTRIAGELGSADHERALAELDVLIDELHGRRGTDDGLGAEDGRTLAFALLFRGNVSAGPERKLRLEEAREAGFRHAVPAAAHEASYRLAEILRDEGDLRTAEEVLAQALERFQEPTDWRPMVAGRLANLLRDRGRFDEALKLLDRTEASLQQQSPLFSLARSQILGCRGQTFIDLGLPDLAFQAFEAERVIAAALPGYGLESIALLHRLTYEQAVFDFGEVVELATKELKEEHLDDGLRTLLLVRRGAARAILARGPGGAEQAAGAGADLRRALEAGDAPEEDALEAELVLADLALLAGELDEAEGWLGAARGRLERRATATSTRPPLEELARLAAHESRLALARGAPPEELAAVRDRLQQAFERVAAAWRETERSPGGLGFLHYDSQRLVLSELVRLSVALDEEGGAETGLDHVLRAQALGTLARALGAEPCDAGELRAGLLDEGVGMLLYLPALDRGHVFAIDREGVLLREIGSRAELETPVRRLNGEVYRAPRWDPDETVRRAELARRRAEIGGQAQEVAAALLPAAVRARMAGWKTVYLVGAELVGDPAFACLPFGASTLGLEKALVHLPSAPAGLALEARRRGFVRELDLDLALLAAPLAPGTQPLPFAASDVAELRGRLGDAEVEVLRGADATRARLAAIGLARCRTLAFFTHGAFDPTRARPRGIALTPGEGDDGFLWCEDVEALPAPPLVLLWTCGAAREPLRRGDAGVASLGGAWLAAGALSVVLTRADVEVEPTRALFLAFAEASAQGAHPAEALRLARRAVAGDERWTDPFHHATFRVFGLGHRVVE